MSPESHPSIGTNIQGPSLIRVPEWVTDPLGRYYLYFADHKGDHIRLAHAEDLTGPWTVHPGGVLSLSESRFLSSPPPASPEDLVALEAAYREHLGDFELETSLLEEVRTPHIASPDVTVDGEARSIDMYFHGLAGLGWQVSRFARSSDGLHFRVEAPVVDGTYLRAFTQGAKDFVLAMPGRVYRRSSPTELEEGPDLFPRSARHSAVRVLGDELQIFWTRVGDAPERILCSTVDARGPWTEWAASDPVEVLRPEEEWEGATLPLRASVRGAATVPANQLRDPAVFEENGRVYLVYAVAGESGLGIAEVLDE